MKIHIVQKGDTLWKLSQKYNVDFQQLKAANNHLSNPDMIMPGMKIKIPSGSIPVKKESHHHHPKEMPTHPKEQPTHPKEQPKLPPTSAPLPQLPPKFPTQPPSHETEINMNVNLYKPQMPQPPKEQPKHHHKEQPKHHHKEQPKPQPPMPPKKEMPIPEPVKPTPPQYEQPPMPPPMPLPVQPQLPYPCYEPMPCPPLIPISPVLPGCGPCGSPMPYSFWQTPYSTVAPYYGQQMMPYPVNQQQMGQQYMVQQPIPYQQPYTQSMYGTDTQMPAMMPQMPAPQSGGDFSPYQMMPQEMQPPVNWQNFYQQPPVSGGNIPMNQPAYEIRPNYPNQFQEFDDFDD